MEIVTAIIGKFVEPIVGYTVAPVARQVGYLIFYRANFENLEGLVGELKRVKDTTIHEVEAERRNGRQINDVAHNWLNAVDEIVEAAEQLSDDPRRRNAGCCKGPFPPNLKSRHQLSRKAKKMAARVGEVMQGKQSIYPLAFSPNLEGVGPTSATSSEKLESRKKLKEDIVLALRDPNLSRIGVYGLGGVGKTTLVIEIAKQVKDDKLFDEVVMANISQAAELERIQGEIADLLGLRFEEMTVVGRGLRLRQRIENEKSILVILDDIWSILELEKLGIPLKDHKGCKLLLTSRNQEILQKMETQKDFLVDVLKKEEAWSLFEDMVGDVVKDVSLRDVANQVAEKCAGLIVLVVTVASALKNQHSIDSWNDALNQLKTVDKEGMNETIYSALELSYNHLEGDDVKALFLLCGLIGPQIVVEDLLKYSVGLGIFKQIDTQKHARFKLHRLIGSLKASCLLLESNSKKEVKMHDIVREVAYSIASRDQHVCKIEMGNELWPTEEFLQRCTQITLLGCRIPKLPERLECPNLKFFYLINGNESLSVPDSFFEGMKNLKVLDLTHMHLTSLPQSFHSLIDLQTICLDHCVLGDMTNIGALTNLLILSLCGSSMIRLPSELGQLTHLRMLDLTDSGIEIFSSNIISKLTKLEELHMGNASIKWDQEDSIEENKNASLAELRNLTNLTALEIQMKRAWFLPRNIMFNNLERYKIVIGDVWEWSDYYGASKMLKLKLGSVIHLEHGIKELIKGVDDLYLDEVNGISNVLYDLNGEGFPLLKYLHIQNNGKIQHIINSMERELSNVFFPRLEILTLQNLNNLEKICHGLFVNSSFAKLRSIKVKCCNQLKYLFSVLMVKALSQLTEIEVSDCSSMKMIVSVEYSFKNSMIVDDNIEFCLLRSLTLRSLPAIEDFYSGLLASSTTTKRSSLLHTHVPSSFFDAKVKFFNLETLTLSSIHLENIWPDDQLSIANSFHKLGKLSVEECGSLKYLFSCSMVGSFPNLKELEIRDCEMMEEIIGTEGRNGSALEEVRFPKLESFVISNMKKLKKVWHSQFDGLKSMKVNNCEKLENIFPFDEMHTTFGRVETLKVRDCRSVKEIFQLPANEEDTITQVTQLKKLHLRDLPELRQIWSKDPQGTFRFHNLQDVLVESCENLEYLFPFSIALNLRQLEKLTMIFCGMNEIVAKKEGPMEENPIFHFDRLYYLLMFIMHRLDRFYGGSHSLSCPSLRVLWVFDCAKLKLWGRRSTSHRHRKDSDLHNPQFSSQQPLFTIEEVIPNLEDWALNNEEAIMVLQDPQWKDRYFSNLKNLRLSNFEEKAAVTFLDSIVQKAPNLKCLFVQHTFLKEIFRDKRVVDKEGKNKINTQLESLYLYNLGLQHICREGFKIDPILEVLQALFVTECDSLKILVPSSVTFSHLTILQIEKCNGLINLICSSTATSLVNLGYIKLKECNLLEEIVTHGTDETRDGIAFSSLRTLALENLPRLKSFSSSQCFFRFPLLDKVVVRECPRMRTFCERATSTPMLRKVVIKEGKDEEWCWECDLNETMKKIYEITFHNSECLNFSWYPELRDCWSRLAEDKTFCNLKSLVVEQCAFLSDVLIPSNLLRALENLEEIQVKDCDSLEVVLEFDTAKEEAISKKENSRLRKIHLSNLPKLQYIWKPSLGGKREEGELQIQHQQPVSFIAKVLFTLEDLEVVECDSLEAIFDVKALNDKAMESKEVSGLKRLTLSGLPNLKYIWNIKAGKIINFGNLQIVKVDKCQQLKNLFSVSLCQDLRQLEELQVESCGVEEIVAIEEGLGELKFDFPWLSVLRLVNLKQLTNFYPKRYTLECPSLKMLNVRGCEKLKIFAFDRLDSQPLNREGDTELQTEQALFHIEKVFQNLEELPLNENDTMRILNGNYEKKLFQSIRMLRLQYFQESPVKFLEHLIQTFPATITLQVRCSSFETLFPLKEISHCSIESSTEIKTMWLFQLKQLEHIWSDDDSTAHPLIQNLEDMYIDECSRLTRLAPPFASFTKLTTLFVNNCNGLMYLMTSFTAKTLVHLTSLEVSNCGMLEEIVITDEGESKEDITFESLEYLELSSLSCFRSFCYGKHTFIFPSLVILTVIGCPKMQSFSSGVISAPSLKSVQVENGKERWKEDLINTTIKQPFLDKAIVEGVECDYEEPSSIIMQSRQTYQKSESISGELSSHEHEVEPKADEIVDSGKEMHKLPIPHAGISTQEMCKIAEMPLDQASQNTFNLTKVDEALGTQDETIKRPLLQATNQAIDPAPLHASKVKSSSTTTPVENVVLAIGNQDIHSIVDKPLIQTDQDEKLATAQNTEKSRDSYIKTQKISDTIKEPTIPATRIVPNSTMITEAALDPSASQAQEAMIPSIHESNIYRNYRGMVDIPEQNMPYLEAGLKLHPQVLDWLNTNRPRVFASSFFSLFSEVTRILRTTRRVNLTEDYRNYIKECCAALQGVGFDEPWISYVHGCIEECAGDEEDLERKAEEAEAQIESMKKELASLEESLVLLRHKASRLHDFIES